MLKDLVRQLFVLFSNIIIYEIGFVEFVNPNLHVRKFAELNLSLIIHVFNFGNK